MHKPICLLLVLAAAGSAQQQKTARPDFKDYAVKWVYVGPPVAPRITKNWRAFRTRIREGANTPTEFAGRYTVPRWGCGAGCSAFAVVDSVTGTVYDGFSVADLPAPWVEKWVEKHDELPRMEFHPNSRLLKINGCPGEQNCGFYDYVMIEGKGLRLVRKELLPREFQ